MNQSLLPIVACSAAGVIVGLLLGTGKSYGPPLQDASCVSSGSTQAAESSGGTRRDAPAPEPTLESAQSKPPVDSEPSTAQVRSAEHQNIQSAPLATPTPPLSSLQVFSVASRISSVGNFVPLSDDQKERLRVKFEEELRARKAQRPAQSESLDDIIGAENAGVYRERLHSAFERSATQALDKEIFYLGRRLNLSSPQEDAFRAVYQRVDAEVESAFAAERSAARYQTDPAARIRSMIAEQEMRTKRLSEELKSVLSRDQLQAYMQEESDSAASELGIWHER